MPTFRREPLESGPERRAVDRIEDEIEPCGAEMAQRRIEGGTEVGPPQHDAGGVEAVFPHQPIAFRLAPHHRHRLRTELAEYLQRVEADAACGGLHEDHAAAPRAAERHQAVPRRQRLHRVGRTVLERPGLGQRPKILFTDIEGAGIAAEAGEHDHAIARTPARHAIAHPADRARGL